MSISFRKATAAGALSAVASASIMMGAGAPASAATLSVGTGKAYATPCKAFAVAAAGDIVEIDGATSYVGDVCGINANNLLIRGINGRPKIDAGGQNAMGKGTWVVAGSGVTVENVEMFGAKVIDKNGAAIRLEGIGFTLRASFLHDNENGILSGANPASDVLIENSEFGHNGYGDGYSHNLYIGQVRSLTFRYNYSHDANVGHNLKSRAQTNTISYNRFSSTVPGQAGTTASGQPSYEIDLPNAGTSYIVGNVIEQPSANQNPTLLAYGEEGTSNAAQDLYVVNNTFLNDDASSGTFILAGSGVTVPILMQNNVFSGVGTTNTQAGALDKNNYRSLSPAFVNRANYDLHPTIGSPMIDAGSTPGSSSTGVSLVPASQYKHLALGEARPVNGLLDIGAYEATAAATADTTPPFIAITNPPSGFVSGTVSVSVTASDNSGPAGITEQLYIDDMLTATGSGGALSYKWNTRKVVAGTHVLKAVARDAAGNLSSTSVQVTK